MNKISQWLSLLNRKFNKFQITLFVVLGVGVGALLIKGVSLGIDTLINRASVCSTGDGQIVYDKLNQVLAAWDDEKKLAQSTSRINLPPRISALQAIRRDVEKQEWPQCSEKAKEHLLKGMNYTIDGFITFLDSDNPEVLATSSLALGESSFTLFKIELEKLKIPKK